MPAINLYVFGTCVFLFIVIGLVIFAYNKDINNIINGDKSEEVTDFANVTTPEFKELLSLEELARNKGTGISLHSLLGTWKFKTVWSNESEKEDSIASLLLRYFSASLELEKLEIEKNGFNTRLLNSISFGILSIKFSGYGILKGSQPLLSFYFESIEFCYLQNVLFKRLLLIPDQNNRPFFALIGIGEKNEWLSARGRGGGLALWIRS